MFVRGLGVAVRAVTFVGPFMRDGIHVCPHGSLRCLERVTLPFGEGARLQAAGRFQYEGQLQSNDKLPSAANWKSRQVFAQSIKAVGGSVAMSFFYAWHKGATAHSPFRACFLRTEVCLQMFTKQPMVKMRVLRENGRNCTHLQRRAGEFRARVDCDG